MEEEGETEGRWRKKRGREWLAEGHEEEGPDEERREEGMWER